MLSNGPLINPHETLRPTDNGKLQKWFLSFDKSESLKRVFSLCEFLYQYCVCIFKRAGVIDNNYTGRQIKFLEP